MSPHSQSPIEQAVTVQSRHYDGVDPAADRQQRIDDAVMLAETGVFSVRHIIAITGLESTFAYQLLAGTNPTKKGGRLNIDDLSHLQDMASEYARTHKADRAMLLAIVHRGTSPRMVARLTGLNLWTIYSWNRAVAL